MSVSPRASLFLPQCTSVLLKEQPPQNATSLITSFHRYYCTHLSKVCSGIDPLQISALKTDVPEEEYRQKDKEPDGKQERTTKKK